MSYKRYREEDQATSLHLMHAVQELLEPLCDKWVTCNNGWDGARYVLSYYRGERHTEILFHLTQGVIEFAAFVPRKGIPSHFAEYRETLELSDPHCLDKIQELFKQHNSEPLTVLEGRTLHWQRQNAY